MLPPLAALACRLVALPCLVLALALVTPLAHAQTSAATTTAEPAGALGSELEQQVRDLALVGTRSAASAASGASGVSAAPRVEVSVGQLDPRLRLAPCQRVEPFIPEGMRLWGKSRVGLRCLQGPAKWSVYLPITVHVYGKALVASSALAAGTVLGAADLARAEVDLAEDNSPPVANADAAVGRTLLHALKPGQSLRQSQLKARQWFAAGETVTVLAQGNGFSVAGEAQALSPGIEGQPARVRTENGRILTGLPVGERRVELPL